MRYASFWRRLFAGLIDFLVIIPILIAHPDAQYFRVGNIANDQVLDYARRKSMDVSDVERWLANKWLS